MSNDINVTKDGDLYRATVEGLPDLVEWAETKEEAIELVEDSIAALRAFGIGIIAPKGD